MNNKITIQDLKKILKYFIIFSVLCAILFYCNTLNVSADTITIGAPQYTIYQNDGTSYTYTGSSINFWGKDFWRGASNFGVVSSDVSFDSQEFFYTNSNWCVGKNLSVSGYITGVYDFFSNGGTVQVYNNNQAMTCTYARENSSLVKYSCTGVGGGSFKIAMYRNNASFSYDTGISKTINLTCDDTLSNVIENDKENTNAIINNQDKNTEEIKDEIHNNFNTDCKNLFNPNNLNVGWLRGEDGKIFNTPTNFRYTNKIKIKPNTSYSLFLGTGVGINSGGYSFYDSSQNFISGSNYGSQRTLHFTTPINASYIVFTLESSDISKVIFNEGSSLISYCEFGSSTNKLDNISGGLNDLNDSITDSSDPNLPIDDVVGWLPPGPVDSILNLPLTILNSIINNLNNKSCNSVQVPLPYLNKNIQLPCLSTIFDQMGVTSTLNTLSIPFTIYLIINTLLKLYGWVDKQLTFRENHWNDVDQWGGI